MWACGNHTFRSALRFALTSAFFLCVPILPVFAQGYTLTNIVDTTTSAPGGGTFNFFGFGWSGGIDSRGRVVFEAGIGGGTYGSGIFLSEGGTLTALAREGDLIPGGGRFGVLSNTPTPAINRSGSVAFFGTITDDPNGVSRGFFRYDPGAGISLVAAQGTIAPTTQFTDIALGMDINNAGAVAFFGTEGGFGDGVYVKEQNGSIRAVVRPGDPEPRGGSFSRIISVPVINSNGSVAFEGRTTTGGLGYFVSGPNGIQVVAQANDPVVGGGVIGGMTTDVAAINDAGAVVFTSTLLNQGQFPVAAFLWDGSQISALAKVGDDAPGGGKFTSVGPAAINNLGVVTLGGMVEQNGVSGMGLYTWQNGKIQTVIAPGTTLFGSLIQQIGTDTQSLNDFGQIAFAYTLADGRTGVGLATPEGLLAEAPEATSGLLLASGLFALILSRLLTRSRKATMITVTSERAARQ